MFELQGWLGPWCSKVMDWYGILCRTFAYIFCNQFGSVALVYWFDRFGGNLILVAGCCCLVLVHV